MIRVYIDSIKRSLEDIESEARCFDDSNLNGLRREIKTLRETIERKNDKIAELQYRVAELGINYGREMKNEPSL